MTQHSNDLAHISRMGGIFNHGKTSGLDCRRNLAIITMASLCPNVGAVAAVTCINKPATNVGCLDPILSVTQPAGRETKTDGPAYAAIKLDVYDWIWEPGMERRSRSINGSTDTIMPEKKRLMSRPSATVAIMKLGFERRSKPRGLS